MLNDGTMQIDSVLMAEGHENCLTVGRCTKGEIYCSNNRELFT